MAKRTTKPVVMLDAFATSYSNWRTDVTQRTRASHDQARAKLVEFLGNKPLAEITATEARAFRAWLMERLATNTARKHLGLIKQMFGHAIRERLIRQNPFDGLARPGERRDVGARYFVSREDTGRLLDACPGPEWRLIVALARFGGLRIPSEIQGLRLADVDVTAGVLFVRFNHQERTVPIFEELRPHLDAALEVPSVSPFVLRRNCTGNTNLRKGLGRIIDRAGLTPWPRLFVNLRWSRGVELLDAHGIANAAAWLGCTPRGVATYYVPDNGHEERRAAQQERVDRILRPSVALVGTGG